MTQPSRCWCGHAPLVPFSPEYFRCPACETLVTARMPEIDLAAVEDDDRDFYGREYWFSHQKDDLGFTDIIQRSRADLSERCLHWLRALLKYRRPPARTLELGSAQGGFVALLAWAGFDATGLELSPWVVDFAHRTFGVPMLRGKLESQAIAAGSLDVIALMDVLEHLPDPVGTMRCCLDLLKPDGFLLIQTPRFMPAQTFDRMVSARDPFLEQLKSIQHLYLFSEGAVRELFRRLGADHVTFEPAIFAHYDMFLTVSRQALVAQEPEAVAASLAATPGGRLVQALLDADDRARGLTVRIAELQSHLAASEADRAARLELIHKQGGEIVDLRRRVASVRELLGPTPRDGKVALGARGGWERLQTLLTSSAEPERRAAASVSASTAPSLEEFSRGIDQFNRSQSNAPLLDAIRAYNHTMIDAFDQSRPLRGKRMLDIGASPHGYALERALRLHVAEYIGVGLDVHEPVEVRSVDGVGRLVAMNAEQLDVPDGRFDLVFSISTFEHVSDVPKVLAEIARVLAPGGGALISFEPIWTCSYGHHLHHFGPVSRLMPDWAHLVWDKARMLAELTPVWPADDPLSLQAAAEWVYDSDAINRVPLARMREHFAASPLTIEWMAPMPDQPRDRARLREVSERLSMPPDDLMTKGLSVLLKKA